MSGILDFITAAPARIQFVAQAAVVLLAVSASLGCWAPWERNAATQARAERDQALYQAAVVSATAEACSEAADHAKRVGDAAVSASEKLQAAAARLKAPVREVVTHTETVIERPSPTQTSECGAAWQSVEDEYHHRKAGAP